MFAGVCGSPSPLRIDRYVSLNNPCGQRIDQRIVADLAARRVRDRITLSEGRWSTPTAQVSACTLAAASVLGDGCAQMGTFCTRRALEGGCGRGGEPGEGSRRSEEH